MVEVNVPVTGMKMRVFPGTITIRSYFSTRYLWSAEHHARLAQEIEDKNAGVTTFLLQHTAYVIDAITDAVAFVEAAVNEVAQDVADGLESYISMLDQSARDKIAGYWAAGSQASTLAKYSSILEFATGVGLDAGAEPYTSMGVLIRLRNHFVHYKPVDEDEATSPSKLASQLRQRKFPDNALMAGQGNTWFPSHALGAGCAAWAVVTARTFVETWSKAMGLKLNFHMVDWSNEPP